MCLQKVISQGPAFPRLPAPLPEADLISFSIKRLLPGAFLPLAHQLPSSLHRFYFKMLM